MTRGKTDDPFQDPQRGAIGCPPHAQDGDAHSQDRDADPDALHAPSNPHAVQRVGTDENTHDCHAHDDADEPRQDVSSGAYDAFCRDVLDAVDRHAATGNVHIKFRHDEKHGIMRIAGPDATPRAVAADGIRDALELAQSTAEHHPYWGLLYNSAEVAEAVLAAWNDKMTDARIEDVRWSLREMTSALDRIAGRDT